MKGFVNKTFIVSVLAYVSGSLAAQEIQVTNVKFAHPIVEKWVTEYKKSYPESQLNVRLNDGKGAVGEGVQVVAGAVKDATPDVGGKVVYVGRFALIPVSNKNNPLLGKIGKGLKKKDLCNIVFDREIIDDDEYYEEEKEKYVATVYSRSGQTPVTQTLAEHFDRSPELIRGKKIVGDEIYLIDAVGKDENGIAYNTLNYVFDLKTRELKQNLTVVPLNLKADVREALLSHNIDRTISLLEDKKVDAIPVENIGISLSGQFAANAEVLRFVGWVLEEGQKFNHELGFLTLDEEVLKAQRKTLRNNILAQNK